jgi:hypothetical protein
MDTLPMLIGGNRTRLLVPCTESWSGPAPLVQITGLQSPKTSNLTFGVDPGQELATAHANSRISDSAFSSQYVMPTSRDIVVAMVRCSSASCCLVRISSSEARVIGAP